VVAEIGERLGRRLDEVGVLAEVFFGLLARGPVVGALGLADRDQELGLLLGEEGQLAPDQVAIRAPEDQSSSL